MDIGHISDLNIKKKSWSRFNLA